MKINWTTFGKRTLLPFAILLAFLPLLDPMNIFSDLRLRSFDTFQQMYPREKMQDDPVVLVDIDDESLSRYGQWPWPRNLVAELVNQTYYSLATGFDIVFAEPDRTGSSQLKRTYQSNPSMINALESVPDPIDTLFPMDTFPKCAIEFHFLFLSLAFPKPSEPITTPEDSMQLFPIMLPC